MSNGSTVQQHSWLGLEAPRYTSYPSAHHFSNAVTAGDHAAWLGAIRPGDTVAAYVHIPFCRELCWFCGCHTKMTYRDEPIEKYVRILLKEIELVCAKTGGKGSLKNIHFGGGSPSLLKPGDLISILYALTSTFAWDPAGEVAIELDPRTSTDENITLYGQLGINRASIGIQDFDARVQKAINRIQPYALVANVVAKLRSAGIANINTDLIYGLPFQTPESFMRTLEQTLTLDPSRIALFSYAHVPHLKKHQRLIDEATLPNDEEKLALYRLATDYFEAHGYTTIGIDHFAKPDDAMAQAMKTHTLRRNFQGYVTDASDILIGFGASAISHFPQGYTQNTAQSHVYKDKTEAGELATLRGWKTQPQDGFRKQIIDELMCYMQVDTGRILSQNDLHADFFHRELQELSAGAYSEILSLNNGEIQLHTPYRMASRAVAAVFDQYRHTPAGRYSKVA